MSSTGQKIKSLRKKLKLTQAEVAQHVGVSSTAIVQWEKDDTKPKGENLLRLAKVLQVTPDEILKKSPADNALKISETPATYSTEQLSKQERDLIEKFRKADRESKKVALRVLEPQK